MIPKVPEPSPQQTLGERLRCCRLKTGRTQDEIAQKMGVNVATLRTWERGVMPADRFWPAVIAFLRNDPSPPSATLGERLRTARRSLGLSMLGLAKAVPCDSETLAKWERGERMPEGQHRDGLADLFAQSSSHASGSRSDQGADERKWGHVQPFVRTAPTEHLAQD